MRSSQLEAATRRALGCTASAFLACGGHHPLGFSRVGDYARERLGISGRELQSFAFVAARLEALPLIAAAFERGELSWSQVRLLCAIACAETEASWLERARDMTVRELVREIRRARGIAGDVADALDEESDATEGEPRTRFSLPCPARVTLMWRRAVELARRMLGSQAPLWQCAEAMVAEASSEVAIDVPNVSPPWGETARSASEGEPPRAPRSPDQRSLDQASPFTLDAQMRARVTTLHSIDAGLGAALRRAVDLRLHRAQGFTSFDAYVQDELGISPAKARALISLERRAKDAPELAHAYRSAEISWVRALAISPVASGAFAAAWIARAREVTVRGLQDEVEWTLDMHDAHGRPLSPPDAGQKLERPDLQTCARSESEPCDRRVTFFGPESVVALFRAGASALTERGEPQWRGFERLLRHAIAEWEAQPRHRDPIFARDGWRCSVPACTGRRSLHDHHIQYRSRGGGNERWNRVSVCASHHLHAVHLSVVGASGRAPDDVVWELGLRPSRAPLLRLHGERYLPIFDN